MASVDDRKAYIHGYTKYKIYTMQETDFGEQESQVLISIKSIYGLKKYMARWHEELSENIKMIGLQPSKSDPDIWM